MFIQLALDLRKITPKVIGLNVVISGYKSGYRIADEGENKSTGEKFRVFSLVFSHSDVVRLEAKPSIEQRGASRLWHVNEYRTIPEELTGQQAVWQWSCWTKKTE